MFQFPFHRHFARLLTWVVAASMLAGGPTPRLGDGSPEPSKRARAASGVQRMGILLPQQAADPAERLAAGTDVECSPFTRTEDSERKSEPIGRIDAVQIERLDWQRPTCAARLALNSDGHLVYRSPLEQVRLQM